jgi:HSP20 family protein
MLPGETSPGMAIAPCPATWKIRPAKRMECIAMNCKTTNRTAGLLPREMENAFEGWLKNWPTLYASEAKPVGSLHVEEAEKSVTIHFDAPGFEGKDFDISFGENTLKVSATHVPAEDLKLPFGKRSFEKVLKLNTDLDGNGIQAQYRSGVLTVTLPKAEKAQWKKIEVA